MYQYKFDYFLMGLPLYISNEKSYDIYQHFSTPSPPLTIGIIIEENVYNYGRPLKTRM